MKKEKGVWMFFITVAGLLFNSIFRFAVWIALYCQLHFDAQHPLFMYLLRTEADSHFVTTIFLIVLIVRATKHLREKVQFFLLKEYNLKIMLANGWTERSASASLRKSPELQLRGLSLLPLDKIVAFLARLAHNTQGGILGIAERLDLRSCPRFSACQQRSD